MVIDHKEPALKVNVTQKSQMGDGTNDSTYTTDGKDNVNKIRSPAGEQDVKSTTKWNGKMLATSRTIEAQGMSIGIDETWDLSPDGKVLTINRSSRRRRAPSARRWCSTRSSACSAITPQRITGSTMCEARSRDV